MRKFTGSLARKVVVGGFLLFAAFAAIFVSFRASDNAPISARYLLPAPALPCADCITLLREAEMPLTVVDITKARSPFLLAILNPEVDTMISKYVLEHQIWDVQVLKAIEEVAWSTCMLGGSAMDVGTNLGFFTQALLAIGCRVHAFEMQPRMIKRNILSACVNGKADRLTLHEGAVSDKEGTLKRVDASGGNLGGVGIANEGINVAARRIDSMIPPSEQIIVMKMDVEGHEPMALRGMTGMFERRQVQNIVMEFTPVAGVDDASAMLEFLYSYGFQKIYELDHVDAAQHDGPLVKRPIDTKAENWAAQFASRIAGGGDSRGLGFVDLLLTLI